MNLHSVCRVRWLQQRWKKKIHNVLYISYVKMASTEIKFRIDQYNISGRGTDYTANEPIR